MNEFVETLKSRVAESRQRLDEARKNFEVVEGVLKKAVAEYTAWEGALQSELRKPVTVAAVGLAAGVAAATATGTQANVPPIAADLNQTDLIRDALRRRPTGLTPAELWKVVGDQVANRSYIYAVLGRLKERDQVYVRRGKYHIKVVEKSEPDGENQELVVQ